MIISFQFLFQYCFRVSKYKINKKKLYIITPLKKWFVVFSILVLILAGAEWYVRVHHITPMDEPYYLEESNIHPFLQYQLNENNNLQNPQLHIDSSGFRGDDISIQKAANTFRIFVLGGSTVLNATIPYEHIFTKLLQDKLRNKYKNIHIVVLNAGSDGYTSEHSLIQYLFKIRDFKPDLIITWQGINDMYYSCPRASISTGEYKSDYSHYYGVLAPIINTYFASTFPVSLQVNFVSFDLLRHFFQYNFYSDLTGLIQKKAGTSRFGRSAKSISMHKYPSLNAFTRNMTYLVKNVAGDKTSLILANQPYLYKKGITMNWFMQQSCLVNNTYPNLESLIYGINLFNNASKNVAKENNVPYIDLASYIPKTTEYFSDDVHYTEKGNILVADILYKYIINNNYIKNK